MKHILTVDIGGTFTKYAVVSGVRKFKIDKKDKIPTPKKNRAEFLNAIAEIFKAHSHVEGIAISMPGLIDSERGVCLASELLSFNNGHCVAEDIQEICGVPVTIENDANCAALAESRTGSLADVKDSFVLVFGSMIGGTFLRNREIYRGVHNCAGEVSFLLNGFDKNKNFYYKDLSVLAFEKKCAEILGMKAQEVTGEMIFDLIADNDDDMLDALYQYAHGVAVLIFNLQVLFDPQRFALGGGISKQKSFIDAVNDKLDELCKDLPAYLPRPEVVACKYFNDANLLGALYRYLKR